MYFSVRSLAVAHFFNGVNYMEFDNKVFLELLYDLDRVCGEIKKIEDKVCKICNANAKSHSTAYTFNTNKNNKKEK